MKYVELVPGLRSSVIGFGCAPILGSIDRDTAQRALSVAFEEGITHFDLARSYGFGEAERLVGTFAKGRRDRIIIATKFGIEATPLALVTRPFKSLVRTLLSVRRHKLRGQTSPAQSPAVGISQKPPSHFTSNLLHTRKEITAKEMVRSLEKSLQELQTDYVDYLFVHEPLSPIERIEELANMANRLKQQGKVRAWGMALMVSQWDIHQDYLSLFDVLQFDNSPNAEHYSRMMKLRGASPNILFSPFRSLASVNPKGEAMTPPNILRKLSQDYPHSVVLCSMFNEKHIRENSKAC